MKAIETEYKGLRFRSRLEARHAVMLDALGIKYEYEREGYQLGNLSYLPDLWLPELDIFIEVKGEIPDDDSEDVEKARQLTMATQKRVYVFSGQIPEDGNFDDVLRPRLDGKTIHGYKWGECPFCHFLAIQINGYPAKHDCKKLQDLDDVVIQIKQDVQPDYLNWIEFKINEFFDFSQTPRLLDAYAAARQARFEFGETPR